MDPALIRALAWGAIPPAIVGAALFAAIWWRRPVDAAQVQPASWKWGARDTLSPWAGVLITLTLTALTAVMHRVIVGSWFRVPPVSSIDAVTIAAALAGVMLAIVTAARAPSGVRWGVIVLALLGGGLLIARRKVLGTWSVSESALAVSIYLPLALALTLSLERLVRTPTKAGWLVILMVVGAASQLLVLEFKSIISGQRAGVIASFLTPALVLMLLGTGRALPAGVGATVGVMLSFVLLQNTLFSQAPKPLAIVIPLALAPLAALLVQRLPLRAGWQRALAPVAAGGLLLAIAAGVAIATKEPSSAY